MLQFQEWISEKFRKEVENDLRSNENFSFEELAEICNNTKFPSCSLKKLVDYGYDEDLQMNFYSFYDSMFDEIRTTYILKPRFNVESNRWGENFYHNKQWYQIVERSIITDELYLVKI